MLDKLQQMYDDLVKMLGKDDLSHYQRELIWNAKNSVKILIAIGED